MALTNFPFDPLLDLAPWVGQRQATFRFELINGVSGEHLGDIHPIRSNPQLSHDTTRTVKRQLTLSLGKDDTEAINTIQDRIRVWMVFGDGTEYPLGRYAFTQQTSQVFSSGDLSNVVLNDEMFVVNQQITTAFDATNLSLTAVAGAPSVTIGTGVANRGSSVARCLQVLLEGFDVTAQVEGSAFVVNQAWAAGTTRGQIMEAMALVCGYYSPWFDNNGVLQFILAFNPALAVPDFDWDAGNQVLRSSISRQNDILSAPNRFVVISNSSGTPTTAVVGQADVPVNAPNSFENRGYYVPAVYDMQVLNTNQAQAVAENLVQRQTFFETANIATAPDPRHDSYNVIKWDGDLWLELAWTMTLSDGQPMTHTLRRAFR